MYTSQCKQVRELMEEKDAKESRIRQLETDVQRLADSGEKLQFGMKKRTEEVSSLA